MTTDNQVTRLKRVVFKKWVIRAVNAVFILIVLSVLTLSFTAKLSGGTPKLFGYQLLTVLSGSMEPSIHTGSIIAIRADGDAASLQAGDVITYRSIDDANSFVTHRIVEVKGTPGQLQYVTKGDNNDAADPQSIPASNVVGKYANFTIPLLGYVFTFAKSKAGLISLLIVPGALLIVWQMMYLWRLIVRPQQEQSKPDEPVMQDSIIHEPSQHV